MEVPNQSIEAAEGNCFFLTPNYCATCCLTEEIECKLDNTKVEEVSAVKLRLGKGEVTVFKGLWGLFP